MNNVRKYVFIINDERNLLSGYLTISVDNRTKQPKPVDNYKLTHQSILGQSKICS